MSCRVLTVLSVVVALAAAMGPAITRDAYGLRVAQVHDFIATDACKVP